MEEKEGTFFQNVDFIRQSEKTGLTEVQTELGRDCKLEVAALWSSQVEVLLDQCFCLCFCCFESHQSEASCGAVEC